MCGSLYLGATFHSLINIGASHFFLTQEVITHEAISTFTPSYVDNDVSSIVTIGDCQSQFSKAN